MQPGFFDWEFRNKKLDTNRDPLVKINTVVPWESFRPLLETIRKKERKGNAGTKLYDAVMMFKILIIQSLYNLSEGGIKYQIMDRISFMRFLGLHLHDRVPDAKTIWLFRKHLTEAGMMKELFQRFDTFLKENGFYAQKGQIVDASIVSAPAQRNSREDSMRIKNGEIPEDWNEAEKRQKNIRCMLCLFAQNFYRFTILLLTDSLKLKNGFLEVPLIDQSILPHYLLELLKVCSTHG